MSAYQPRFQTLNQVYFSEPGSFHLFPRLPAELRVKIWENALCTRRRLLTMSLAPPDGLNSPAGYRIFMDQKPRINPLWSTCQESRQAAREHFRLPLCIDDGTMLLLSPESDHIFIAEFDVETDVFINFINHLKATDPRGKGILHFAFNSFCSTTLEFLRALSPHQTDEISQEAIGTFKQWVLNLQSLWFIHILYQDSRLGYGLLSGTKNYSILGLNRSMPIFPETVEFNLFASDPRPIKPSLEGQTVWKDPKSAVQAWVEVEKQLGYHDQKRSNKEPTREISHILAMGQRCGYRGLAPCNVRCHKTMDDFLQKEQESLHKLFVDGPGGDLYGDMWKETEERKRNLLSAAGFWVFPRGTFDTLDKRLGGKAYQDLSGLQPGLGLFDL